MKDKPDRQNSMDKPERQWAYAAYLALPLPTVVWLFYNFCAGPYTLEDQARRDLLASFSLFVLVSAGILAMAFTIPHWRHPQILSLAVINIAYFGCSFLQGGAILLTWAYALVGVGLPLWSLFQPRRVTTELNDLHGRTVV